MRDLKAGDRVLIKSWKKMKKEFGLSCNGDINCNYLFTRDMKHLCKTIATLEERFYFEDTFIVDNYVISKDIVEAIICKEAEDTSKLYNDWRVPTIQELLTLVDYTKHNPACDLEDTITSNYYWSSTTLASGTSYAWFVDFNYGYTDYYDKTYSVYVRYVRNGKDGLEWSESSKARMTWDEAFRYTEDLFAPIYYKG